VLSFAQNDFTHRVGPHLAELVGLAGVLRLQVQHQALNPLELLDLVDLRNVRLAQFLVFQHVLIGQVASHHRLAQKVPGDEDGAVGLRRVQPQLAFDLEHFGAALAGRRLVMAVGFGHALHPRVDFQRAHPAAVVHDEPPFHVLGLRPQVVVDLDDQFLRIEAAKILFGRPGRGRSGHPTNEEGGQKRRF